MNILLTGATGFIGSKLVVKLTEQNHNLVLFKRSSNNLDILFEKNKIDAIVHLATKYVKHENTEKELSEMISTNITFPTLLLEKVKKYRVKYFVNTGTCFEYRPSKTMIKETDLLDPFNFYAATKLAFEQILKYYCQKKYIKAITLKLFFPYGENDHNYKLIPSLINAFLRKKEIKITDGKQQLDFTYVDDIAVAYVKSLEYIEKTYSKDYSVFNIGSGQAILIKKIVEILKKLNGSKNKIKFDEIPSNRREIMFMEADNRKARDVLGWSPKYDVEKGLSQTYNYSKQSFLRRRESRLKFQ